MQMSIQAVISDLGGVIVRTHDHQPRARWERQLGMAPPALGQIEPDDLWTWVIDRLALTPDDRSVLESDFWAGDSVDDRLIDYFRGLRPRLKTALLSNAWTNLRTALEAQWKIADAFDVVVISAEVGLAKPDPRIYQLALTKLGISPEEAVFLDDMQENIDAARFVGMHAVRFASTEQAIGDIDRIVATDTG
jgi:HAD superfamily hydrolase (TIGR01509 family)